MHELNTLIQQPNQTLLSLKSTSTTVVNCEVLCSPLVPGHKCLTQVSSGRQIILECRFPGLFYGLQ